MEIAFGAKTDVGLRRSHNEDSLCVDPELGLFLVCDGMGGRNAGEVASQLAVEMIQTHMREARFNRGLPLIGEHDPKFSPRTNRLASAIRLANEVVYGAGRSNPDQVGMGTTVVAAVITDQVLSVAHVGDSRLYLLRGDEIQSLTTDHSLVAEQVRRGLLTEEEAQESPQRNIVTRALGVEQSVDVELDEIQLFPGDTLLLCSDGLTRSIKPAEILKVVHSAPEPQTVCERLVETANAAGGEDNTTVIQLNVRKAPVQGFWQRLWRRVAG